MMPSLNISHIFKFSELLRETIYDFYLDEKEAKIIAPSYWEKSDMGKRK